MPILWKSQWRDITTDTRMLCVHTMPENKLTLCWMRRRTTVDRIVWILLRSALGLRLDRGPSCFFGFSGGTRMPLPTAPSGVWVSNTVLMVCVTWRSRRHLRRISTVRFRSRLAQSRGHSAAISALAGFLPVLLVEKWPWFTSEGH